MRLLRPCTLLLSLSVSLSTFSQNAQPAAASGADAAPVDLSSFRDDIAQKNKSLNDTVSVEKAIVKKNSEIIQDAKKIDAANKKLEAARRALEEQNAQFEKEREAMQAEQTDTDTPSTQRPAAPARVQPARAPAAPASVAADYPPPARTLTPRSYEAATNPSPVPPTPAPVRQQAISTPPASVVTPAPAPVPQTARTSSPRMNDATEAPGADAAIKTDAGIKTASVNSGPLAVSSESIKATAVAPAKPTGPLRVSAGISQGMLLAPIRVVYPQIAMTAQVEGSVVLDAVISKKGTVQNVRAVSGPLMLRDAAIEAIKEAHYQPYKLNEEPIEVQTTITVAFALRH